MKEYGKLGLFILIFLLLLNGTAWAVESPVVTLGADLSAAQKQEMVEFFKVDIGEVPILEVTNDEEYRYLKGIADRNEIGTRAISSVYLELLPDGKGIEVDTHNITWVTPEMYATVLVTAGVKDARIVAAAPFPVSGTAALTGVVKAFEEATGEKLSEESKELAHEELVILGRLQEETGDEEQSTKLVQKAKEEVLRNRPQSAEEIQEIITRLAQENGLELSEERIAELSRFLQRFNDLGITLEDLREQLSSFLKDPERRSFLVSLLDMVKKLIEGLLNLLQSQ